MPEPTLAVERSDPPRLADSMESGVQIGDFVIERRLGAGGMGIVYQARQISLNRLVALKVLGQALSYDADVVRFQREAQAAARLSHPSIAQVYYIGQDAHLCYMAMELVDGVSLRRALDRLGCANSSDTSLDTVVKADLQHAPQSVSVRFDQPTEVLPARNNSTDTPRDALSDSAANPYISPKARELRTSLAHIRRSAELARDAAEALAHAHEQGVVHRDIKPDNLLLDRQGKLHLIDFGVARFFEDQAVTYTGQLVGTPLYMSPEQVTGRGGIDARTDIYSLGLVLYELLTLRRPVESLNRENLLRNIVTKPLPPVSWRNEAVPEELARIVHRATQKDPDQRYATAKEFAEDLNRFLAAKPVAAPPYHYRFDEREITAARPSSVVLAAFVISMIATVLSLGMASVAVMMLFMGGFGPTLMVAAVQGTIAIGIVVGAVFVSRGVLSAHVWARWAGVILFGLICLGATIGLSGCAVVALTVPGMMPVRATDPAAEETPEGEEAPPKAASVDFRPMIYGMVGMYSLPLLVGLLLGGAGIWWLVERRTGQWFAFAAQLRLEHQVLKENFQ